MVLIINYLTERFNTLNSKSTGSFKSLIGFATGINIANAKTFSPADASGPKIVAG
jgi:hypothetical protein